MKTALKYIGNIIYGIFILFLVAISSTFILTLLPPSMTGPIGDIQIKIVKSGSMEPSIPTGSVVVVQPAAAYMAGDVVTFGEERAGKIPTTHRIVETHIQNGRTTYLTKGDANEEADPVSVAQSDVVGKAILTVPYAGYIIDFARQPLGFTFLIGIPAALIIVDELFQIVIEVGKLRRKKKKRTAAHKVTPISTGDWKLGEYFDRPPEKPGPIVNIRSFDIPPPERKQKP